MIFFLKMVDDREIQQSPDLVTVNIVNIPGLVKELLLTILLLLLSKITVDLVKNLDLVKFFLLTKNFTKSGLYCISKYFVSRSFE